MLLLVLLHKEDVEDLQQQNIGSAKIPPGVSTTHFLLAEQTVVDRLVRSVAVEPDRNVILQGELLHQHGLLEGPHESPLHGDVEIRIRDLGLRRVLMIFK